MTANRAKLVMVGLDSFDLDYLEQNIDRLPNLRRLFEDGIVRRLDSPGSVMSASVWPTFFTRSNPGEHGRYFPIQWDPAAMRLRHVESAWFDTEPFWRPLAREGLEVTTLDVQMALPNPTAAGTEIVNWGVNVFGGFQCNRPEIGREIERRFGTNVLGPDVPVDKSSSRLAEMQRTILAAARRRGKLVRWLFETVPSDFFLAVFPEGHRAGHYFWHGSKGDADFLFEIHRALDEETGSLLARVDLRDTTFVVFSLLGMGPNQSQMHLVAPVLDRLHEVLEADGGAGQRRPVRPGLMRSLRERLPASLQERIALSVPESVRDWVIDRAHAAADWPATQGLSLPTGGEGYLRFNVVGREARGCLEPGGERYRRYRDSVRESFLSLRDAATGEPLAETVTFAGEAFPGPRSGYLPDVAIGWRPLAPVTEARSDVLGTFSGRLKTGRGGNHRPVAFAAVAGPSRVLTRAKSMASIIDLASLARSVAVGDERPE